MLKKLQHFVRRSALLTAYSSIVLITSCQHEEEVLPAPVAAEISVADIHLAAPNQVTTTAAQAWLRQASGRRKVQLNWAQALTSGSWLVVPFVDQKNPFASGRKQGYRYLVTQELDNGKYTGYIIEIILDGLGNSPEQVNRLMLYAVQRYKSAPRSIPGFNGWIVIYSPAYKHQTSLVYQKGILQPQSVRINTTFSTETTARKGLTSSSTTVSNEPTSNYVAPICVSGLICGTVNGHDAGCTMVRYCGSGGSGDSGSGSGDGGNGGDGSGGDSGWGGDSGPPPTPFDEKIDDSQLSPCAVAILNDLKGLNNGQVANVIQHFAGESPTYNWTVKSGTLIPGLNAATLSYNLATHTVTTTFDTGKFSHATDLSVARTILHESIHAYIGAYFVDNPTLFKASYPDLIQAYAANINASANSLQHDNMVKNWVLSIATSLEQYGRAKGYNLPFDYYSAMAWGGLEGTRAFQKLPNRNSIQEIILAELTGKDSSGNTAIQKGKPSNCP